jgi:hypothetical protein
MTKMSNKEEFQKLINEDVSLRSDCNLCKESSTEIGKSTGYGNLIYKIGDKDNGWYAALSPKTGGGQKFDFTIQLMPILHLTHFSQIESHKLLSQNYGMTFSKLCRAMTQIMMADKESYSIAKDKSKSIPIGTYGKATTWKEKKEHLHIKIFPFRGEIGQPYTVDSSYGKKKVFKDIDGKEYVKMNPVRKKYIDKVRFEKLTNELVKILNDY